MRKAHLELLLIIIAIIGIHSARSSQGGFINGKLYPMNAGESVVAISGKDSVKSLSRNGYFGTGSRYHPATAGGHACREVRDTRAGVRGAPAPAGSLARYGGAERHWGAASCRAWRRSVK